MVVARHRAIDGQDFAEECVRRVEIPLVLGDQRQIVDHSSERGMGLPVEAARVGDAALEHRARLGEALERAQDEPVSRSHHDLARMRRAGAVLTIEV
jgi:hypothetical protein